MLHNGLGPACMPEACKPAGRYDFVVVSDEQSLIARARHLSSGLFRRNPAELIVYKFKVSKNTAMNYSPC